MSALPGFWDAAASGAVSPVAATGAVRALRGLPAMRSEAAAAWSYGGAHPAWVDADAALARAWRAAMGSDAALSVLVAPLLAAALYGVARDERAPLLAQAPAMLDAPVRDAFGRLRENRPADPVVRHCARAWTALLATRATGRTRAVSALVSATAPHYIAEFDALSRDVPPTLAAAPDAAAASVVVDWLERTLGAHT